MQRAPTEKTRTYYHRSLCGSCGVEGSVYSLAALTDPLILNRIALTFFRETPPHVAALCGHLEFTRALLKHKPGLAAEMDRGNRCSPHHLAAANACVRGKLLLQRCWMRALVLAQLVTERGFTIAGLRWC